MAQFDVHPNPGKLKGVIPFIVVVQSAVFDGSERRVVAPLVLAREFGRIASKRFNPKFTVEGLEVVLQPLELVSVPAHLLGSAVASLREEGQSIVDALDELMSQAYG
jgi:toxin CcdB